MLRTVNDISPSPQPVWRPPRKLVHKSAVMSSPTRIDRRKPEHYEVAFGNRNVARCENAPIRAKSIEASPAAKENMQIMLAYAVALRPRESNRSLQFSPSAAGNTPSPSHELPNDKRA